MLTFSGFLSLGFSAGLLGVAWPSIAASLAVDPASLGVLIAASSVGFMLTSVWSGRLIHWMGVGGVLALSCFTTALSMVGLASAPRWLFLLLANALLGMGEGVIDAGLNGYAANHYSSRVLHWMHAFFGLGATIGPLLMTALLQAGLAWRWGYLLIGSGQLVLAISFLLTRRRWIDGTTTATPAPHAHAPIQALLRLPALWMGSLVFLLYTGLEVGIGQWSYTLFTLGRAIPAPLAGQWIGLYWGSLTVGRVVVGFVANRLTPRQLLWIGAIGALMGTSLVAVGDGVWGACGLLLAGFSLAPLFPALVATTPNRVPAAYVTDTVGIQIASAVLGSALVPWTLGLLVSGYGLAIIGPGLVVVAGLYGASYALLDR